MENKFTESVKAVRVPMIVGAILVVIGLVGDYFFWLGIGTIVLLYSLTNLGMRLFYKKPGYDIDENVGCVFVFIGGLFVFLSFLFGSTRYITPSGYKQHIYEDCSTIKHPQTVKKVSELEGFFHFRFADCKRCEKRKEKEDKMEQKMWRRRREERKQREREEKIQELQEQIDALRNGADVDDIEEDYPEYDDDDEYRKNIPSRYW